MHKVPADIFPSMWGISLDPMRLPFKVDGSFRKRRQKPAVVGLVLQTLMRKFNAPTRSALHFMQGTEFVLTFELSVAN